ncbi:unnamed protein product, partial [Didymodactylos carnosus]
IAMVKKQKVKNKNQPAKSFRFLTLNERLNSININVVHRIKYDSDQLQQPQTDTTVAIIHSSYFYDSLQHWYGLNYSESFTSLYQELVPLAISLEQIVYHQDKIVNILLRYLNEHNIHTVQTLLDLIVQLARDLQQDFYVYYKAKLFSEIVQLLNVKYADTNSLEINTVILEYVFQCLTYLFKYLWRTMLKDMRDVYELYSKYLFLSSANTNQQYIRTFAAESFAFLLRKIENFQPFIDYLFDQRLVGINKDENQSLHTDDDNELECLSLLFYETCSNLQHTFHSCTKTLLSCLLNKIVEQREKSLIKCETCFYRTFELLIKHTNQENSQLLWTCLLNVYQTTIVNNKQIIEICQPFYKCMKLLIQHQNEQITSEEITSCTQFLTMINPNILSENVDKDFLICHYSLVYQLMQCTNKMTDNYIHRHVVEINYRFVQYTPVELLFDHTKQIFENDLTNKYSSMKEFHYHLWNHLLANSINEEQLINWIVEYVIMMRKKNNQILLPNDRKDLVRIKLDNSSKYLSTYMPEKGLTLIENFNMQIFHETVEFFQASSTQVSNPFIIFSRLWRSFILLSSVSLSDKLLSYLVTKLKSILSSFIEKIMCDNQVSVIKPSLFSLTLIETLHFVYNNCFSTLNDLFISNISFWYKFIQCSNSIESEHVLHCVNVAMTLNQKIKNDIYREKFYNLLKDNLSSFQSNIRLLTLNILAAFDHPTRIAKIKTKQEQQNGITDNEECEENDRKRLKTEQLSVFDVCSQIEQIELSVHDYRDKVVHLQKLETDFLFFTTKYEYDVPLRYLLGLLSVNFTPIWKLITEIIGSYGAHDMIVKIGKQIFWNIINEKLLNVTEMIRTEKTSSVLLIDNHDDLLLNFYIEQIKIKENELQLYVTNEKSIDYIQYRINLWKIMEQFPNECEAKTKLLVPMILDFFHHEYYDRILVVDLQSSSNKSSFTTDLAHTTIRRLNRHLSLKTLESILNVLKHFRHSEQWYNGEYLYQFYLRLLMSSDNRIQQLAYECLLTCTRLKCSEIKSDFLLHHKDEFLPIFDNATTRKCFYDIIARMTNDNQELNVSLKHQYSFILIRILYSKLNQKRLSSTTRGRHDYIETNRKFLLQFLITYSSTSIYRQEMIYFLKLILEPFKDEDGKNDYFNTKISKVDIESENNYSLMKACTNILNDTHYSYKDKQFVIEIIWNLTQTDEDVEDTNIGLKIILPHIHSVLTYLTTVSNSMINKKISRISLTLKEFDILVVLCSYVDNNEVCEQLCSILVRVLRQNILKKQKISKDKKNKQPQQINVAVLKVLQKLFSYVNEPLKYVNLLAILWLKIIARDQRAQLSNLFQTLLNRIQSQENQNATEIRSVWYLERLIALNSWNSKQIEEPDYERRLESYKELTNYFQKTDFSHYQQEEGDTNLLLCLFYTCLYELNNSSELALRECSSSVIEQFIRHMTKFRLILLAEIRSILKHCSQELVRNEYIRYLALIIEYDDSDELKELKRLKNNENIDQDFFENIRHLQIHRRLRALKRLKLLNDDEQFSQNTISHYLVPIVCSFINDVLRMNSTDSGYTVNDDVYMCLTHLCKQLSWIKYQQLFVQYFRQLTSATKVLNTPQKRCLAKTINAIVDAFHFDLTKSENSTSEDLSMDRISRTIRERLLPMILTLLSQNSFSIDGLLSNSKDTSNIEEKQQQTDNTTIDEQRQQAVLVTTTCSLISIKILSYFPSVYIEQYLSTILLHLIQLLRSRLYSIREQARDYLIKCIRILGKRYLKYIIQEICENLKRGYQHFVCLHTVHSILIHLSTTTSEQNDNDIDSAIQLIVQLFTDDLFNDKTESSKASEHENSVYKPSNVPEAKTNKTYNAYELIGQMLKSPKELYTCIEPLRKQLEVTNDSKQINKCEKCLKRFQQGLITNSNLDNDILFIFTYTLLKQTSSNEQDIDNSENKKKEKEKLKAASVTTSCYLIPAEPKRDRRIQMVKTMKKTNLHCLTTWLLQLLGRLIKRQKLVEEQQQQQQQNEKLISMLDPFVHYIETCLNQTQYIDVTVAALRNLASLLQYKLPSLDKQRITNMYKKVFDLLKTYIMNTQRSNGSDMNDLLTLCYKILSYFVQRSSSDNIQLSVDEYQCLFNYIESDLLNQNRQTSAFVLLRSIMKHTKEQINIHKELRQQLDDLITTKIMVMSVQNPYERIRTSCREIFRIYLFDYEPHSKQKLKTYFDFYLLQIDYKNVDGRLSAIHVLQSIFNDLSKQQLQSYSTYFFLPIVCHLYNETDVECKKLLVNAIKVLLIKLEKQQRNDLFINIVLVWTKETETIEHRCLASQLIIRFIEVDKENFDQYVNDIFDFIQREFEIENNSIQDDDDLQRFYDHYFYNLLNILLKISIECENALHLKQLRSKWLLLLKIIDEKFLLHPHLWIRLITTQLLGIFFSASQPTYMAEKIHRFQGISSSTKSQQLNTEPLFLHYILLDKSPITKIQRLCICSCSQLKPSGISQELSEQVTKNLIYLSKIALHYELLINDDNDKEEICSIIVARCCRLATFESTKHPTETSRRSSILKWMAALALEHGTHIIKYLKQLLSIIEREIERISITDDKTSLKTLATDVFDVFKKYIGLHIVTETYAELVTERRTKRFERKQKSAVMAINQPEIVYRKKRKKQTKRIGLGKKKRTKQQSGKKQQTIINGHDKNDF